MLKRLNILTVLWVILISVWQVRPDPIKQIFVGQSHTAILFQSGLILLPMLALMVYSFLPNKVNNWLNKFPVFKVTQHIKYLPITLGVLFVLDVLNALHPFSSNTFTAVGLGYLVMLQAAYRNRELGGTKALAVGLVTGLGTIYLWEIIYQLLIYYKADWNVYGNMTFAISGVIVMGYLLLLVMSRVKTNQSTKWYALLFGVVTVWWLLSKWTWVVDINGIWTTEKFDSIMFVFTRVSKAALGMMLASLTFVPLATRFKSTDKDFYDKQSNSINPVRRIWNRGRQQVTRQLVEKYYGN